MSIYQRHELTCKPLDSYSEVLLFIQNPPAWRSLCKEITPHSKLKINNFEANKHEGVSRTMIDGPESFCHYDPDADEADRFPENTLPKTLVCHDMANGYHDDCIIDGTCNYDAYTFYNWAGIDIFCYFSHHLITIPPLGWINVGHAHGVKVIGTVITEWADGVDFWDEVLASESEYKNFASALVVIAKTLKFDGWLLNVENKIAKPDLLLAFVKHLHELLHQELTDPVLIWYDSVTVDGHLNWQNALNHKNRAFFEACDGIFTNYSWSPDDVKASAVEAGARLTDVYIGIDVWGRNFFGGGEFNIQEAIELAHSHGCSLAIFAPAWTHEALTTDQSDTNLVALAEQLEPYEHFLLRDRALWDSVWRYLHTRLPCQLPFKTSFCRGQGETRRLYGEVICPGSWYNLRHMQYQPNASHGQHGYLLSTVENIASASRTGILRDPKGIIRYRQSLEQTTKPTNEKHDLEHKNEYELENKLEDGLEHKQEHEHEQESEPGKKPQADSVGEPEDPDQQTNSCGSIKKPTLSLKRKMKNVFKHVFGGSKTRKEEEKKREVDPHQKLEINETEPELKRESKEKLDVIPESSDTDVNQPNVSQNTSSRRLQEAAKEIERRRSWSPSKEIIEPIVQKPHEEHLGDDEVYDHEVTESTGESMVRMSINIQLKDKKTKTRYGLACVPDELQCMEVIFEDSFNGGSCLQINPSDPHSRDHRRIRLFYCDFPCESKLIFCVVTKHVIDYEEQFLNIKLNMRDAGDKRVEITLVGRDVPQALHSEKSAGFIKNVAPVVSTAAGDDFHELQKYMLLNEPGFYVPVENAFHWIVRYYEVDMPGYRVTSINCDTGLSHGPILLGHLAICHRREENYQKSIQ